MIFWPECFFFHSMYFIVLSVVWVWSACRCPQSAVSLSPRTKLLAILAGFVLIDHGLHGQWCYRNDLVYHTHLAPDHKDLNHELDIPSCRSSSAFGRLRSHRWWCCGNYHNKIGRAPQWPADVDAREQTAESREWSHLWRYLAWFRHSRLSGVKYWVVFWKTAMLAILLYLLVLQFPRMQEQQPAPYTFWDFEIKHVYWNKWTYNMLSSVCFGSFNLMVETWEQKCALTLLHAMSLKTSPSYSQPLDLCI